MSSRYTRPVTTRERATGAPTEAQTTGLGDMSTDEFRAAAHAVVDLMADYLASVETRAVLPGIEPGTVGPLFAPEAPDDPDPLADGARWTTILAKSALGGDRRNRFTVADPRPWRALRLNIYPDGGVARLRAWGMVQADWSAVGNDEVVDLFAIERGGIALVANDQHYGDIRNLNRPGRGVNMGDGWETRRRREPGNDWCIVALAMPGVIEAIDVDTAHFKGNYPDRCSLQGAAVAAGTPSLTRATKWVVTCGWACCGRWRTPTSRQSRTTSSPSSEGIASIRTLRGASR